jgi:hypothetical protein
MPKKSEVQNEAIIEACRQWTTAYDAAKDADKKASEARTFERQAFARLGDMLESKRSDNTTDAEQN